MMSEALAPAGVEQVVRVPQAGAHILSFWSKNSASRTQIFQVQATKTGHVSIIYQQSGDILSIFGKGTAAAR